MFNFIILYKQHIFNFNFNLTTALHPGGWLFAVRTK